MDERANTEEAREQEPQEFSVTFRNGALAKLRKVARELGIPEERLGDVLVKGLNLIDVGKEGTTITIEKKNGRYEIDLRRL
ncbi:hypothetical protein HY416_01365 [Candidatus Kaiserbacteria bacterium]|nr:hypothetical protein [Candidatus Kaiserbacteria bacterium]